MKLTARIATTFETAGTGARSQRSPFALAATLFASVALLLAVAAPAANAATATDSYGYLTTFGAPAFAIDAQFNAVAVNGSTGNIFLPRPYDPETFTENDVRVFSPDPVAGGVPLATVNGAEQGLLPLTVAVDQADGSLYIADYGSRKIFRYLTDGAPAPTYTFDPSFSSPTLNFPNGLAIDPVTHDVLVGDRVSKRVYRLDPTGALVSSFDGSNTAAGAFKNVAGLAVGPTGTIYVVDDDGHRVEEFNTAGASLGTLPVGGNPSVIAVNPQSDEVAVLVGRQGQTFIEGFSAAGAQTFSSRVPSQAPGGGVGLAWDAGTGRIYLAVAGGNIHTFIPAKQPGLDPPVVTQITGTSAHLEAEVVPGEGETTSARFEYCPATAACGSYLVSNPGDSSNPWVRLPPHDGLTGSGEVIEDDLTGLLPHAGYLVRVSADSVSAETAITDNTSAATPLDTPLIPPGVQTGAAGAITDTLAELTGTIDTFSGQTTYRFEYGLTTSYGSSAPAEAEGVAGNSRTPRTFARTVTGLQPGTDYHYRLVAKNAAGTTLGLDRTFTTVSADEVAPGRGYEQVSPVDKRGATIATFGFQLAADGSAVEYNTFAPGTDAAGAPLYTRYFSRRGSSDWSDWQPLDPPQNVGRGVMEATTKAVSPDFTHALVASNRVLAPGATDAGGNLYIEDLQTGAYTLVGAAPGGNNAYLALAGLSSADVYLQGAPDFSWVVIASRAPLLPGVTAPAVYKWTQADGLEVESRLPDGSVPSGAASTLSGNQLSEREVSDDGNTLYFALYGADAGPDAGVYRRTNGQTTAISVSQIPGAPATPLPGSLDGVSRDGRYAIFRSGRLTPDAAAVGSSLQPADLYQYDSVTGDLTFIGTTDSITAGGAFGISEDAQTVYFDHFDQSTEPAISDTKVWRDGTVHTVIADHPNRSLVANASPDGRFLAYLGAGSNAYLYDADTEATVCVSCRADGSSSGDAGLTLAGRDIANRIPQVVTDSGMVFFDTAARLIPADHNGTRDVYSYQEGKTTLISPGDGNFNAQFADATADGNSIFFVTDEPLVSRDTDGALDLYVFRIGGGFPAQSPPAPAAACARSECAEADSGPLSSPPVGSSLSQSAAKPKKHCPKGTRARKVKGKIRCVKPSKHKKKAIRANTNRRQGR